MKITKCEHKFRTNLDSLSGLSELSEYITVIFCESCGIVAYDANASSNPYQEAQKPPALIKKGKL